MPPRPRKGRQRGAKHERKDQHDADRVRARGDDALDGEAVEQPDGQHEEGQDDGRDEHGHGGGDAGARVVVDGFVLGFGAGFLFKGKG